MIKRGYTGRNLAKLRVVETCLSQSNTAIQSDTQGGRSGNVLSPLRKRIAVDHVVVSR